MAFMAFVEVYEALHSSISHVWLPWCNFYPFVSLIILLIISNKLNNNGLLMLFVASLSLLPLVAKGCQLDVRLQRGGL